MSVPQLSQPGSVVEAVVRPRRPYSLAASAGRSDPTRRFHGGVLDLALITPAGPAQIRVWQRRDGDLVARTAAPDPGAALDALRFVLAVDVDHTPFLRLAATDPLLCGRGAAAGGPAAGAAGDGCPRPRPGGVRPADHGPRGDADRAAAARSDLRTGRRAAPAAGGRPISLA